MFYTGMAFLRMHCIDVLKLNGTLVKNISILFQIADFGILINYTSITVQILISRYTFRGLLT